MATTKKSATVEIKPMELQTVDITIVGTTPLIIHAWSDKAKQMMLDKQRGKATKSKHEIKIPVNDFMAACYWLTEQPELGADDEEAEANYEAAIAAGAKFGFPVTGIKQSAIMGAKRGGLDVVATELRGSFFLEGATEASTNDIAEIISEPPTMREDMVKVGGMSKTADIRYRPQFDNWEIPMRMTYNVNGKYSLEQLLNCFNVGGFACGIGEWRPERDGSFGKFHIEAK
jgi:hypothetical protein